MAKKTLPSSAFSKLNSAFKRLQSLGEQEETFDIEGMSITVRQLRFEDSLFVSELSMGAFASAKEDGMMETSSIVQHFKVLQTETLARAIIQIDDLDLRAVQFMETGELTDAGVPVKVPVVEALKGFLEPWSSSLVAGVYERYQRMTQAVEARIEEKVKGTPADIDTEVSRLQSRIKELEDQKIQRVDALKVDHAMRMNQLNASAPEEATVQEFPLQQRVVPQERIIPEEAPPPEPLRSEKSTEVPVDDTFFDPEDVDAIAKANEIMARRRGALASLATPKPLDLDQMAAKNTKPLEIDPVPSRNPRFRGR